MVQEETNNEQKLRKERVKVYCRIRPLNTGQDANVHPSVPEVEENTTFALTGGLSSTLGTDESCIRHVDSTTNTISLKKDNNECREFSYDSIFEPATSQESMYQKAAFDIVQDVMEGYNGTILAYGQTGTGKTHTMVGPGNISTGETRGIIPRALEDIFESVKVLSKTKDIQVNISYVQIYCERIFDLLSPETPSSSLLIREDPNDGVFVQGITDAYVNSTRECLNLISLGNSNRAVAATTMNVHSSRSHAVVVLKIEQKELDAASASMKLRCSRLFLVDLAGSERVSKSMVYGTHLDELKSINLSLSALGNCISALSQKRKHVPYRDSKLTRLLQSSLGGNAKTCLIITITPSASELSENISTLTFGQRAMKIEVQAHLNIQPDYKALYESFQSRIDERDDRINELQMELQNLKSEYSNKQDALESAILEKQNLQLQLDTTKQTLEAMANEMDGAAIGDISSRFDNQITSIQQKHHDELIQIKQKYETQVMTYKQVSNSASQEWHHIEYELSSEREAHLKTLKEYREFREKYNQLEQESNERIAELLQDYKSLQEANSKKDHETLSSHQEIAKKEAKLMETAKLFEESKEGYHRLQEEMKQDYVSREQVEQMESLYSDAIERLKERVFSLEEVKKADMNTAPSQKSKTRAVAKVGRVVPGGRER